MKRLAMISFALVFSISASAKTLATADFKAQPQKAVSLNEVEGSHPVELPDFSLIKNSDTRKADVNFSCENAAGAKFEEGQPGFVDCLSDKDSGPLKTKTSGSGTIWSTEKR